MVAKRYGGWVDKTEAERLQVLETKVCTVRENLRREEMYRYSNRANRKMDFSGLLGELKFERELTLFIPCHMPHRDCISEEILHL